MTCRTYAPRRLKEADAIFELGLARRAEPQKRLRKRRDEFQARMLVARPSPALDDAPAPLVRPALGSSRSAPLASSQSRSGAASALPNNGAPLFAVFSDTADGSGGAGSGTWDDLGTVESRRRENVREATAWSGETLPTDGSIAVPRTTERIEVFRDEVRRRATERS